LAHASESYEFGGCDSKSNPLAIPSNRALRCVNWVPNPGGWLELRRGYKPVIPNMVTNGGFEGSGGWNLPDGATIVTSRAHTGSSSLRVSGNTAYLETSQTNPAAATAGATYNFSGWVFIESYSGSMGVNIGVQHLDATGNNLCSSGASSNTSTLGVWQQVTGQIVAVTGAVSLRFYCEVNGGTLSTPGAVVAYFDDILLTDTAQIGVPIHSLADYQLLDSNGLPVRFLMVGAGTGVWTLNLQTLALTQVGTLPTSDKWGVFYANGQIHIGTKAGVWFWDGTKLRKSGIRTLTAGESRGIASLVLPGPTAGQQAAVTVAGASTGGTINAVASGIQVYMLYVNKVTQMAGPAVAVGSPIKFASGSANSINLTGLPNLSSQDPNLVKCFAWTADGGSAAYPCQYALLGTVTNTTGNTLRVTGAQSHAPAVGDIVHYEIYSQHASSPMYLLYHAFCTVTATGGSGSAFYFEFVPAQIPSGSDQYASIFSVVSASNAGTTATITKTAVAYTYANATDDVSKYAGIPPTAVTSAQPGYQLYASIYNPSTGHVGNRVAICSRLAPTTPCTVVLSGLPNIRSEDTEFYLLIGCTVDGGEVPYALMNGAGDWLSVPADGSNITISGDYSLDFESELPTRNGIPPAMDRFCTIGDWVLGATGRDTLVYVSGSAAAALNPVVLGRPEQSWAPDDVTMFPFREIPLNLQELGNDAIVFSGPHMARLVYAQGIWDWADTFPMGVAGRRAYTNSDQGPYWINYKKKLATIGANGPVEVSGEYERALLSKIGDTYMDDVTLMHLHNVDKYQNQIVIKARDSNGNPFEVIHDFNLQGQSTYEMSQNANGERTYQANGQTTGQGYVRNYAGVLSSDYVMADCEDVNGFARCYYGGPDGNIYLGQEGWNDNGVEYSAEYVGLQNLGPDRPSIYDISLWGDTDILNQQVFSWRTDLDGSGDWNTTEPQRFPGEEKDMRYHHQFNSGDLHMFYYRFQLNSHSADAPTVELNDLPHLPLEGYGKIYMARAVYSDVVRGQ